jgi:hypothetical protein
MLCFSRSLVALKVCAEILPGRVYGEAVWPKSGCPNRTANDVPSVTSLPRALLSN